MRPHRLRRSVTALGLATAVAAGMLSISAPAASGSAAGPAATPAANAMSAPAAAARRRSPKSRIGFTGQVTMNVKFAMSPRRQRQDIRRATKKADVIGWQEINRHNQTRTIDRLRGWNTYWPGGGRPDGKVWRYASNTSPISWRRGTWKLVRGGSRLASREIPSIVRERYLTFVVLKHRRSGAKILRWNVHFVPSAMDDSRVRRKARRRKEWRRASRTVAGLLDQVSGWGYAAVIGGGDINWRSKFVGGRVSYDTDHHRIDYLTHVRSRRVKAQDPRFTRMNSDHDRVRVGYTLYE